MGKRVEARQMALEVLATPPKAGLLATPLDYILAEHMRQRTLCWLLDHIAETGVQRQGLLAAALRFLTDDLGPHVLDEERDLFPLLRQRAEPEDGVEEVLAQLTAEHAVDHDDADAIVAALTSGLALAEGDRLEPEFCALLKRFAANEKRHLIVENAIVLPLARARLTPDDLAELGRRMAARRGLKFADLADAV